MSATAHEVVTSRELPLLLVVNFAFGIAFSIFVLLPKILASTLHAGPEGIGLVMSMFSFAGLAAVPFVGARVDRPGRPRVVLGRDTFSREQVR